MQLIMNTTILNERVFNSTINASNDELLIEKLKGYFNNKFDDDDEREELGDEDEDNDNDERKELGDDEDDDFEDQGESDYDEDLEEDDDEIEEEYEDD